MNQHATRIIIGVRPAGNGLYDWTVQLSPASGHGARRSAAGQRGSRKLAIAEAIRQAGTLTSVEVAVPEGNGQHEVSQGRGGSRPESPER